jgi:hypothetical protein
LSKFVRISGKCLASYSVAGARTLSLLDENDPLNCGIEITAKPPGKQLQSVSLLSGGERAMTAGRVAVCDLHGAPKSVLHSRRSGCATRRKQYQLLHPRARPFRAARANSSLSRTTKRTIAKADVLYGVTMEERGVSKLGRRQTRLPRRNLSAEPASNGDAPRAETAAPRVRGALLAQASCLVGQAGVSPADALLDAQIHGPEAHWPHKQGCLCYKIFLRALADLG